MNLSTSDVCLKLFLSFSSFKIEFLLLIFIFFGSKFARLYEEGFFLYTIFFCVVRFSKEIYSRRQQTSCNFVRKKKVFPNSTINHRQRCEGWKREEKFFTLIHCSVTFILKVKVYRARFYRYFLFLLAWGKVF